MTRPIFTALFACVALTAAAPAFAQDQDVRVARVSYAGMDLGSPEGSRLLKAKLEGAVVAVCGDADIMELRAAREVRLCRARAHAQADAGFQRAVAQAATGGSIQLASR